MRRRRRHRPRLLIAAVLALLIAWVMATMPFQAPDEASHYLRAYTITTGHLLGQKAPYGRGLPLTPTQLAWANQSAREVRVPAAMSPPNVLCRDGQPDRTRTGCEEVTEVGAYQPLPYLLPAVGLALSSDATTGLWTARFLSALPCAALLTLAVLLLWDGTLVSILGLILALSPMVFFVGSVLNPNGLEISASVALLAGLLRVARERSGGSRRLWAVVAVTGVLTVLAWQLGPVFVLVDALVAALAAGPLRLIDGVRRRRRAAIAATVAVVASLVLYVLYGQISNSTHLHIGIRPIRANLHLGLLQLGPALRDSVGDFGGVSIHLPGAVYWADWSVIVGFVVVACLLGTVWDKLKLVGVLLGALAFPVLFYAFVYQYTGFGIQGRYILPVVMVIPVYAGEVIYRRVRSDAAVTGWLGQAVGWMLRAVCVYAGALEIAGWWIDARSVSAASGVLPSSGSWSPPLGWWPWMILAVAGGGCVIACGLRATTLRLPTPTVTSEQP